MRNLSVVPNIGGTSSAYPDGVIVDNASGITGTALTEMLYGDLIQTVHKLKRLAAITPNELPDNETNGFQLLRAFIEQSVPKWQPPSSNVVFSNIQFVTYNNGLYFHKTANNTTNNPSVDTTNWASVFYWDGTKFVFSNTYNKSEVYNKTEIDAALLLRALKTNVIEKDSMVAYTPTLPTHPLNRKYIDDRKASGSFVMVEPWNNSTYFIEIGKTMAHFDYHVSLMSINSHGFRGLYPPSIINRTTTSFTVQISIENSGILTQPTVQWFLQMPD